MFVVGLGLIVVVCVIWSVASLVVKDVQAEGVDAFFITFVCNSLFVLYWPWAAYTKQKPAPCAKWLSPVWMIAQATYNLSLRWTSISSSTVLSTTSAVWALFFAVRWQIEPRSGVSRRLLGAFLCILGAALVSTDDSKRTRSSLLGDFMALFSAFLYGLYAASLSLYDASNARFFGAMGAWNFVYFIVPLTVYLWLLSTHDTSLAASTGLKPPVNLGLVVLKGLFDNVLSDFLYAKAVSFTTPTVATLGLALTIPLALLTDIFLTDAVSRVPRKFALSLVGALFVLVGFFVTTLQSYSSSSSLPEGTSSSSSQEQQQQQQSPPLSSGSLLRREGSGGALVSPAHIGDVEASSSVVSSSAGQHSRGDEDDAFLLPDSPRVIDALSPPRRALV